MAGKCPVCVRPWDGPRAREQESGREEGVDCRGVQNQAWGWQEIQALPWLYEPGSVYGALAIPGHTVPTGVAADTDCRAVFGEVS